MISAVFVRNCFSTTSKLQKRDGLVLFSRVRYIKSSGGEIILGRVKMNYPSVLSLVHNLANQKVNQSLFCTRIKQLKIRKSRSSGGKS